MLKWITRFGLFLFRINQGCIFCRIQGGNDFFINGVKMNHKNWTLIIIFFTLLHFRIFFLPISSLNIEQISELRANILFQVRLRILLKEGLCPAAAAVYACKPKKTFQKRYLNWGEKIIFWRGGGVMISKQNIHPWNSF